MAHDIERDALPTWSAHTLVMTLLEGPDHFNGHCTCDGWSYRTDDWADLGAKWAWHYVAESGGPDGHPSARQIVRAELERSGDYGGDCPGCGHPIIRGRTHCLACEQDTAAEAGDDHGDDCESSVPASGVTEVDVGDHRAILHTGISHVKEDYGGQGERELVGVAAQAGGRG